MEPKPMSTRKKAMVAFLSMFTLFVVVVVVAALLGIGMTSDSFSSLLAVPIIAGGMAYLYVVLSDGFTAWFNKK